MKEPCVAGGSWVCPRWAVGNMETGSASARERERSLMKVAGGTSVQAKTNVSSMPPSNDYTKTCC